MSDARLPPLAISAGDAGGLFGISERTWWTMHSAGRCPAPRKVGRSTRWDVRELRDWWQAGAPSRVQWERTRADQGARLERTENGGIRLGSK